MSEHIVHLIGGKDDEVAVVTCAPRDGLCHIVFRYRDRSIEESSTDHFEALCQVRLRLEAEKLIPFCYGASLNVFPSGMGRDMGAGMKAYRTVIGKHADPKKDLVGIFEEGPDVIPSGVVSRRSILMSGLNPKEPNQSLQPTALLGCG